MAANCEDLWTDRHEFIVILGHRQLIFDDYDNAIDALDRCGIICEDGTANDALQRRTILSSAETVEMWP
jgi:hypothetical protein